MRLSRAGRASFCALVLAATACGKQNSGSLVAPTSDPAPSATPIAINGGIFETAPTADTAIPLATVRITDSSNAGQWTTTDVWGRYTLSGLKPGQFTIVASAEGFVDQSQSVSAYGDTTVNVHLKPVPRTMHHTSTGTIAATDGTCSDGVAQRPCRILMVPVHNEGSTTATLTWIGDKSPDLDLTLFQTGGPSPLARSNHSGAGPEQITATIPGGSTYEFRMTWAAGTGSAQYTIEVAYPY